MNSQFRNVSEVAMGDFISDEIERIQKYIDGGPLGWKFNIEREFRFIRDQKEITMDMHNAGYIDDTRFCIDTMMLSARYMRLVCYQNEMFDRYSDIKKLNTDLRCSVCGTKWNPSNWTRTSIRNGNCPDCGFTGEEE